MRLSSTRQAIHDALSWGWQQGESSMVQYLTYLTRIEKSIRNLEPCGDFLEAAFICAAINTLGTPGGWLKFAYGPDDLPTIQTELAAALRWDFPMGSVRKHRRLLALAMTALEDHRLGYWQNKHIPIQLYAERMEVYEDNFERDWGEKRRLMFKHIIRWDREGVGQVSRMVHALQGPTDFEDRPTMILKNISGK